MDNRPIGVYDSGMGGISIWKAIRHSLPNESIVYLGDGKNCPYGDKDSASIVEYAFKAVETLLEHNCKMIVVACNTATSVAIGKLRSVYPAIKFVGMEPAIKPACMTTKSGVVAVLATRRSLESELFTSTLAKYASGVEVIKQVGEGFVEIVERGAESDRSTYDVVESIVDTIASKGADKIVLGCTHYPFLRNHIERAITNREIDIIEPSSAIVKRIKTLLNECDIEAEESNVITDLFLSFDGAEYCNRLRDKAYE